MQIRNPCKKCLVRAACEKRCNKRQNYWDTREKFWVSMGPVFFLIINVMIVLVSFFSEKGE
jgi:hypothetical protein